jgi:hypothetical protein
MERLLNAETRRRGDEETRIWGDKERFRVEAKFAYL